MMKNASGSPLSVKSSSDDRGSASPADPAVRVSNLRVRRRRRETLHGLTFDLPTGTITGLLGPSGCGKTTLMRVLVGVQHYDGEVTVLGAEPGAPAVRDRIGYVTQEAAVYKDLTARQNLRYFASLAGPRARDVDEVLAVVGLTDLADRRVSTYSGGEANRASLACALVAGPELLVLDEPTVGLDPLTREDLWDAFQDLAAQGATLLVSSHVMDEAFRCQSVLLMRDGSLLAATTAPELLDRTGAATLDEAFLAVIRRADDDGADAGRSGDAVGRDGALQGAEAAR